MSNRINPPLHKATQGQGKTYVLGMFPYPSGDGLHVGHVRIYTAVDVMARYFRMKANVSDPRLSREAGSTRAQVLAPMGWDAFGLPAENAAIKAKVNPTEIVPKNCKNFRSQMENLDMSFDWDRELATTDPTYYGITQWIFLELYKKGLVYREQVAINWCPKCKTGLANEEVLSDGTHERCGEVTSKKELPQWVMRITEYADRLLEDLDGELDWPRGILEMQRNWIGKKEGVRVQFAVGSDQLAGVKTLETFTTRIDTIYGVTFVVIAPEMANEWMDNNWEASIEVREYVEKSLVKTEQARLADVKEKTGVDTGLTVVNPANGESVPVWVADYVLSSVGTGAVMGVPSYDERDGEFASKYGLEIKEIELEDKEAIFEKLAKVGVVEKETTWHLRDWVFSRQRYWGEPIPLVHCNKCGVVPLSEKELPLTLPDLDSYEPTDTGESPLVRVEEWVNTTCPMCGNDARRETDTMPNWAGSCWYHLAFAFWRGENPKSKITNDKQAQNHKSQIKNEKSTKEVIKEYKEKSERPFSDFWKEYAKPKINDWLPVDWYLGGAEHAVLHLLYARFWNKVLHDLGHVDFPEPYLRLRSVGMVLASDGRKMSKSWGNVINPDEMVAKHGSDAVRLYEMFMGPWDQAIAWDERALVGMKRFISRVMKTVEGTDPARMVLAGEGETSPELAQELAKLIEKVGKGIVNQKFNTSIAGMMELVNMWRSEGMMMSMIDAQKFAQIMSPFAPKLAQSIWELIDKSQIQNDKLQTNQKHQIQNNKTRKITKVADMEWPSMEVVEVEVPVTIAVQVNGKLRATIEVDGQIAGDEEQVMKLVMGDGRVAKWVSGEVKKVVFVPGRLVNLVV